MMLLWTFIFVPLLLLHSNSQGADINVAEKGLPKYDAESLSWDENGYIFFCLCMGRFGNQAEHFLGGLSFAKSLNRTLVLPPFRTYRNVRFTEYFKLEPILEYHKVVLAEDFMKKLAPIHWPPGQRKGFCYLPYTGNTRNGEAQQCNMKQGNPFKPFWDGLGVDFDQEIVYHITYRDHELEKWHKEFSAKKYPVLALRGAPASFPMETRDRFLQKYLIFSDQVDGEAEEYILDNFQKESFIGLHLRNGGDWVNACQGVKGRPKYMASPQCLEGTDYTLSTDMCYPSNEEILRLTGQIISQTGIKIVFVATDKFPMKTEIETHFKKEQVKVFHADPHNPLIDLAILQKSDHFIGNCVSSFTSFVTRARKEHGNKPTSFWGFS